VVRWNTKPCPCGETHRRLFYEGRVRDIVPVGDVEVLPIDVALVLYEFPEVSRPSAEYQIVRGAGPADELHVRVEDEAGGGLDLADLTRRLTDRFLHRLGVRAGIEFVARGAVPRFAYKAARVVDEGR